MRETAYAKINLALHVRRRREDGYHELETLFAFVDAGDVLTAKPAAQDSVSTLGEFAGGLDNPFDNLVAKASVHDKGEALLRPGSVVIQRGTNHAWANRSGKVCRMLFVLVSGRYDSVIAAFLKDAP